MTKNYKIALVVAMGWALVGMTIIMEEGADPLLMLLSFTPIFVVVAYGFVTGFKK